MSTVAPAEPHRGDADAPELPVVPRSLKVPVTFTVFGIIALLGFGLFGTESGQQSTFALSLPRDAVQITPVSLPSQATALVLSLACLALAALAWWWWSRRVQSPLWASLLFGFLWLTAFLVWAVEGRSIPFTGLLQGTLLLAVPIVFGALSGVLCERAGVINIAIEGQLLTGAFMGASVGSLTGNLYAGLVAAALGGLFFGWLLAVFAITYVVDQIIVGVVLNVLALGLTNFLYGQLMTENPERWNNPGRFDRLPIPLLADIPIIGPVLFDQTIIVYLMYVTVAVVHVALFRTRWGLRVRAVGEHPTAADTVGIKVNVVRWRNVLLGGAVAGLGGAYFTLGSVGSFSREMTAGRGFIALAAMIFGRWSPTGALAAALLFGFASSLQIVLTPIGTPIPGEFMLMAPYLATIFAVAGLVGRVRAPAADGQPYVKS